MDVNCIVEKLGRLEGVVQVNVIDGGTLMDLRAEESNINLSSGMEYENRALEECCNRDVHLCLFCDGFVEESDSITMVLMDCFGNITGNDVPKCMMSEYSAKEDIIWLADNFILYPNSRQQSESKVVILPRDFRALDCEDGITNISSFYPSVSSDVMLKERFMAKGSPRMSTLIVAFDRR